MQETARKRNEPSDFCHENLQNMPAFARNLVQLLGFNTANLILKQLGGASWRIPATDKQGHERDTLISLIGEQAYSQLQRHFAGEVIYVPRCYKAMQAVRDNQIKTTLKQCAQNLKPKTQAIRELVKTYQLSDRRIAQIAAQHKPDNPQKGLF